MQFNRARYYDPEIGRWTSQDPLGFEAGDSNLYGYVKNRFVSDSDPSGLQNPGTLQDQPIAQIPPFVTFLPTTPFSNAAIAVELLNNYQKGASFKHISNKKGAEIRLAQLENFSPKGRQILQKDLDAAAQVIHAAANDIRLWGLGKDKTGTINQRVKRWFAGGIQQYYSLVGLETVGLTQPTLGTVSCAHLIYKIGHKEVVPNPLGNGGIDKVAKNKIVAGFLGMSQHLRNDIIRVQSSPFYYGNAIASAHQKKNTIVVYPNRYWSYLDTDRITTLVHEASHAIIGTTDHGYQEQWGRPFFYQYEKKRVFLTTKQLVDNADSYAGFVQEYIK